MIAAKPDAVYDTTTGTLQRIEPSQGSVVGDRVAAFYEALPAAVRFEAAIVGPLLVAFVANLSEDLFV